MRTNFVGLPVAVLSNSTAAPLSAADEEAALSAQWRQQWLQQNQRPPDPTDEEYTEEEADKLCPPLSDA